MAEKTEQLRLETAERRSVEKALTESRESYRSVVNTMMDAAVIVNQEGRILFVNPAFTRMYQYTREEILGRHARHLIHPDYHSLFGQFMKDLDSKGYFSGGTIDIRKNGSTFHTDVRGADILYEGQPCFLGLIRDVTEQKKLEAAIIKSAREWRITFDSSNSVIWILDADCRIIRSNTKAETVFRRPLEKILGRYCWEIVHGSAGPIADCPHTRARDSLERETAELRIGESWYEVTIDPILRDGQYDKAVHIITDITKRKAAEKERETLILKLRKALDEIKTLRGIIPICSRCKKIRDDQGYWNKLESFLQQHSQASFSHGMCPQCSDELYGDEDWYIDMKKKKKSP